MRWLIEKWRAWRRGEVRIAPRGVRGRVYAKRGQGGGMTAQGISRGTLKPTRVYRAATDTWEDI